MARTRSRELTRKEQDRDVERVAALLVRLCGDRHARDAFRAWCRGVNVAPEDLRPGPNADRILEALIGDTDRLEALVVEDQVDGVEAAFRRWRLRDLHAERILAAAALRSTAIH